MVFAYLELGARMSINRITRSKEIVKLSYYFYAFTGYSDLLNLNYKQWSHVYQPVQMDPSG